MAKTKPVKESILEAEREVRKGVEQRKKALRERDTWNWQGAPTPKARKKGK